MKKKKEFKKGINEILKNIINEKTLERLHEKPILQLVRLHGFEALDQPEVKEYLKILVHTLRKKETKEEERKKCNKNLSTFIKALTSPDDFIPPKYFHDTLKEINKFFSDVKKCCSLCDGNKCQKKLICPELHKQIIKAKYPLMAATKKPLKQFLNYDRPSIAHREMMRLKGLGKERRSSKIDKPTISDYRELIKVYDKRLLE